MYAVSVRQVASSHLHCDLMRHSLSAVQHPVSLLMDKAHSRTPSENRDWAVPVRRRSCDWNPALLSDLSESRLIMPLATRIEGARQSTKILDRAYSVEASWSINKSSRLSKRWESSQRHSARQSPMSLWGKWIVNLVWLTHPWSTHTHTRENLFSSWETDIKSV